ncbi:MAG: T9SS type A sorting domain-containing protein [Sphingobacteriaceae bacterium]|nr:T9SS type A sorting domain-containing protein [Sphingobacteriaceae bacterium]
MNKLNLLLIFCLLSLFSISQNVEPKYSEEPVCGTKIPSAEYDAWFNAEVEKFKTKMYQGKAQMVNYTIPVIVHILHAGEAVGTYPNISQAQVASQITALNNAFNGTGNTNVNVTFSSIPAPFQPLVSNTGVQFCLAVSDPTGTPLTEPGIERIDVNGNSWTDPATLGSSNAIMNFINNTVKPATIWDPTKYFNIWISAKATDTGLLGYATFPSGTSLTGIPGGFVGTNTSDGVWCYAKIFGNQTGTLWATYDKGSVMAHEAGHWLGLRHMWGDGNCLTDFCNDTPWHKSPTSSGACKTYPYLVNECGAGQSPNGRMFMNYMDYSDDDCMYMFTPDQTARIQTAMSQGTHRNLLGTHGLCTTGGTVAPGPAVAQFTINKQPCVGSIFSPSNTSIGGPVPNYTWTIFPGGSFSPNQNAPSPAITLPGPGNYTLTLVATNTAGTSSYTMAISNVTTCPKQPVCLDTLGGLRNIDTLTTYAAPSSSFVTACQVPNYTGFLSGTNCFGDREFAQFYPQNTYSDTPLPQVNSLLVLFDSLATKSTPTTSNTQIFFRVYGGTPQNGPGAMLGQYSDSLGAIAASASKTNQVQYAGNPNVIYANSRIIPWSVNFTAPVIVPTSGFFGSVQTPWTSPGDSIRIFTNTKTTSANDSSAWVLLAANNWRTMRYYRNAKVQLAIFAQITCRPIVGVKEESTFATNITAMPNPTEGKMSLVFTLPKPQNIKIRVMNYLGQEISYAAYNDVLNQVFDIDLSTKSDGVYFVEISNGQNEKITKKIIKSH